MKYLKYLLIIALFAPIESVAQVGFDKDSVKNYYVSSTSSAIFDTTSLNSNILFTLKKHDNVQVLPNNKDGWVKIAYKGKIGYSVATDYKPGKVVINTYRYRTGAVCKDGSRSSATGRGACSHHGGVSRWVYGSRESIRIID